MNKTEQTIAYLSEHAAPAIRYLPACVQLALVISGSALWIAALLLAAGIRPDLAERAAAPHFAASTLLLLTACFAFALAALQSTRPQAKWRRAALAASGALIIWALGGLALLSSSGEALFVPGAACFAAALFIAVLPAALLLAFAWRAAPLQSRTTAALALAAAGTAGALALQFHCPTDSTGHILLWHGMPAAAAALAGWLFGATVLNWQSRVEKVRGRICSTFMVSYFP